MQNSDQVPPSKTPPGVAPIKQEFIVPDRVWILALECVAEKDRDQLKNLAAVADEGESYEKDGVGDDPPSKTRKLSKSQKKKLKGQNKNRPPPLKYMMGEKLCASLIDIPESGIPIDCTYKNCAFRHDLEKFVADKPPDIAEKCYLFDTYGKCPWGVTCRFGTEHISPNFRNIVNEKLWSAHRENTSTVNALAKELQTTLRKQRYNFDKSVKILNEFVQDCSSGDKHSCSADDRQAERNTVAKVEGRDKSNLGLQVPSSDSEKNMSAVLSPQETNVALTVNDASLQPDVNGEAHSETFVEMEKKVMPTESQGVSANLEEVNDRLGPASDEDIIKIRPVEKKRLDWNGKLYLAPLTTVGNLPFRRICKQFGADITCGEMAMAASLLQGYNQEWALNKRHRSEDIFGVQVCGNNPWLLTKCAQMLEEQNKIDFVDINLGCPLDNVYRQGSGSGMMTRRRPLEVTVRCMSQILSVPVTVKLRTGLYMDKKIAHKLVPNFCEWGASLITLHGRSREQRYTKQADWEYISHCAKLADPVPLFGGGDVLSYEDYNRHMKDTGIAGVMIARGALIKPWLFTEIKEQRHWDISSHERFDILKDYTNFGLEHWGSDTQGVEKTRRFLLEWLSFLHRYIPVGILERLPQKINERPPYYKGRDELETLMASPSCADWVKISEMLLGPVPGNFLFLPKHKANSWR